MVDSFEGRVAVTVRNFTGLLPDSTFQVAFLWPNNDGATMADVPPRYRGLRNADEIDVVRVGRLRRAEIQGGKVFDDQSSPLAALLTLYSAIVHKDKERFIAAVAAPDIKEAAEEQFDIILGIVGDQLPQMMGILDFLGTLPEPENPRNGQPHPVYLCRTGSLLCELTLNFTYQDGKWYLQKIEPGGKRQGSSDGEVDTRLTGEKAVLSAATYEGLRPGRFMTEWLFLGPITIPWQGDGFFPDDPAQRKAFDEEPFSVERFEPEVTIHEKKYEWGVLTSDYGVVNLTHIEPNWYKTAYAWAQIEMAEETSCILGLGSDDSVKVWLNGKLVHENWTFRGLTPDTDRVPVTFRKGKNQLVLKIQNGGGDWGFCCRLLE